MISKIVIINLSEVEPLIEDIQWLFDETISIEAMMGDYLAAYVELTDSELKPDLTDTSVDSVIDLIIQDYETAGLFVTLTAEHRDSVIKTLIQIYTILALLLSESEVELDDEPAWQMMGIRGTSHVILAQAKAGLTSEDIQNTIDDIKEGIHELRNISK